MSKPAVTDHAVLKYLQRVGGVDVERVRRHIWMQCRSAISHGQSLQTVGGISYKIIDGHVITITAVKFPEAEAISEE